MADMKKLAVFLATLRTLRAKTVESEVDFFQRMAKGEADEDMWKGDPGARSGFLTFADLLKSENICEPHRLEAYKEVVEQLGFDHVREIGIEAARLVATIPADAPSLKVQGRTARVGILTDTHASRVRNKTTPSLQQVGAIRRQHYAPPPAPPRLVVSDADKIRDLERKNARLEKTLARVTGERDAALAKLAKLRGEGKVARAAVA